MAQSRWEAYETQTARTLAQPVRERPYLVLGNNNVCVPGPCHVLLGEVNLESLDERVIWVDVVALAWVSQHFGCAPNTAREPFVSATGSGQRPRASWSRTDRLQHARWGGARPCTAAGRRRRSSHERRALRAPREVASLGPLLPIEEEEAADDDELRVLARDHVRPRRVGVRETREVLLYPVADVGGAPQSARQYDKLLLKA